MRKWLSIGRVKGCLVGLALSGTFGLALLSAGAPHEARASASPALLPNLVADPPDNAELVTSSVEADARLLLRFDGYVHNAGPGALDIRGSRGQPKVAGKDTEELSEEIERYKRLEQSLPQALEEELAVPAMKVSQRVFTTNEGSPALAEQYVERPHVEEPSEAQLAYSNADGHHHWHLQHVAKYSLWNATKTAEVAPAQKVGFCLEDNQHVEPEKGPSTPIYANDVPPYQGFCDRFEPNATSVYEGISPGWRDIYERQLAWQWVDVSDVLPGEYWLREDIDPTGVIKQTGGGAKFEYSKTPTIIPGFDAEPQTVSVGEDEPKTLELVARAYQDSALPLYTLVSGPQHGTLGEAHGSQVTYTPALGYSGTDTFTFDVRDPNSQFPEHPEVATVSIDVASHAASLMISGAQAEMDAATSIELSATVANDTGGVEWEASAGTIAPEGAGGYGSRYTSPSEPAAGGETVTITARLRDDPAVSDERTITIKPAPRAEPAPELPPEPAASSETASSPTPKAISPGVPATGGSEQPQTKASAPTIAPPRAMLVGRMLVMSTEASAAGRVRLAAYLRGRALGGCSSAIPAGRTFTCRITLRRGISLRAPISLRASLRSGGVLVQAQRAARRVPEMKMKPIGALSRTASAAGVLWCSPSTLTGVLVGE